MTKLIGLFKDQQKAENAIEQLAAAEMENIEFETISQWEQKRELGAEVVTGLNAGSGASAVPVAARFPASWNLNDEEQLFFKRAVQNGGVLIVVDVNDEDNESRVRSILQETGEKVTTGS